MDRAMKAPLARVGGALALGAFLLHAGQHLARGFPGPLPWTARAAVALPLVGAVAASWARARLHVKRPAAWAAFVLLGVAPVGAFLLHRAHLDAAGGYGVVLLPRLLLGASTVAFVDMLPAAPRGKAGEARTRKKSLEGIVQPVGEGCPTFRGIVWFHSIPPPASQELSARILTLPPPVAV